MALEKMMIKNLDSGEDPFPVLFNPTEYSIEDGSNWQDQNAHRRRPEIQYVNGKRKRLSMELFFDTHEAKQDVRQHTGRFAKMLLVTVNDKNTGKRPPKLELSWGAADEATGFPFVGVLDSLKQQFTLFAESGTPVRAKLDVTFIEFILPLSELLKNPRANSFPAQTHVVQAGETPSWIASDIWKDPFRWRIIARFNEIDNPRQLEAGRILEIPAIE